MTSKLLKNFAALKRDYGEFLALKGMLNIPMVRYPFEKLHGDSVSQFHNIVYTYDSLATVEQQVKISW